MDWRDRLWRLYLADVDCPQGQAAWQEMHRFFWHAAMGGSDRDLAKAQGKFGLTRGLARFGRDINTLQLTRRVLCSHVIIEFLAIHKAAVVAHPCHQMQVGRPARIVFVDITFAVCHHGDCRGSGQNVPCRFGALDPAQ